jgi:hypothetical protein
MEKTPAEYCDELMAILGTDREAIRAAAWNSASGAARMIAVRCAHMPKEKAGQALKEFDAMERGLINLHVARLIHDLERVHKAMNGGAMPRDEGGAGRLNQANGIAAPGIY